MSQATSTEIVIDARPERVWATLTDFERYGEWNPFIPRLEGAARVGARLDAHIRPAGRTATRIRPVVTHAEPDRHLAWLGRIGIRGLYDGHHHFELDATDDGETRLRHWERFSGLLVRPVNRLLGDAVHDGFVAMNEALKERVEAG
ncbi:MAG: SRPBCC domain-containing protein [Acidimicrobiia bacterium]|nr:SRPBCC domain-containing protein [Acidimicrobiia bacterium]